MKTYIITVIYNQFMPAFSIRGFKFLFNFNFFEVRSNKMKL